MRRAGAEGRIHLRTETAAAMLAVCKDGTVTSKTLTKERVTPPPATVKAAQQPRDRCAECAPPPTGVTLRRRRRAAHPRRFPAEFSFGIPLCV